MAENWPQAFHWWIDSVGGFLTFTKPIVTIGQAGQAENDVTVLGDLGSRHAELRRGETGWILIAHADTAVNGVQANTFLLRHNDVVTMRSVKWQVHAPASACTTTRLALVSRHRMPLALDGIVLLGNTCVLGPRSDAHIRTTWNDSLFVNWHRDRYWVRGTGPLKIDGKVHQNYGPLEPTSTVQGSWGTFRWEPAVVVPPSGGKTARSSSRREGEIVVPPLVG